MRVMSIFKCKFGGLMLVNFCSKNGELVQTWNASNEFVLLPPQSEESIHPLTLANLKI